MGENKKILIIAIPSAFIGFIMLISITTGTNPIDSMFLLIGQTIMYIGLLFIFGAPVFILFALISMTVSERIKDKEPDDSKNLLRIGGKRFKKNKAKKAKKPSEDKKYKKRST